MLFFREDTRVLMVVVQKGKLKVLNERDECQQLMQKSVSCDTAAMQSWLPWVESLSKKSCVAMKCRKLDVLRNNVE